VAEKSRTIEQTSDISRRYAQDRQKLEDLNREIPLDTAKMIPERAKTTVTKAAYESELANIVRSSKGVKSFAKFCPPPGLEHQGNLFSSAIIPSFGNVNTQKQELERLESSLSTLDSDKNSDASKIRLCIQERNDLNEMLQTIHNMLKKFVKG